MRFSDEMLMAYADGELDLVARAEIEAAMATDPRIAQIVERHRALAEQVRSAYGSVPDEPVPDRLAALAKPPAPAIPVPLAAWRAARARARSTAGRLGLPQWAALAATLALGLFVGAFVARGPAAPFATNGAGLVARGDLDTALTRRLAGSLGTGGPQVGITFRDRSGAYCRTFHLQQAVPLAGLACRAGGDWQLKVLAAAAPREGGMQPAAAMPIAVLHAVDAAIQGEPLDAAAEKAARDAGWQ